MVLSSERNLPTPDFSYKPHPPPFVAGLRPYRRKSYRLEAETLGDKFVIHNYGHGGAGITMSWGCAHEVRDLVVARSFALEETRAAVLGAGVIGLTTASILREIGLDVTVYAKQFVPHTTSNIAGGQWAPSVVEYDKSPDGVRKFQRILRRAFEDHRSRIGQGFGVSRRTNYTWSRSGSFEIVPKDVIPEAKYWQRLPFEGHPVSGYEYHTLLIEPPIFLSRLHNDLSIAGVEFVKMEFSGADDVLKLTEKLVVNCTGLGSRNIWPDDDLLPVKGHLVLLTPQPNLEYLYSGNGYIFPRNDSVVVGGTAEWGVEDDTPDPTICAGIVSYIKALFKGDLRALHQPPRWLLRDK